MIEFPDLSRLVRPESVALIGASDTPGSIGKLTVDNLVEASEFRGRVHLVNPRRREIGGRVCHPDVAALPEAPDVAVVCIPAAGVLEALRQCAAKGVRFAIVLTSGFSETGEAGRALQEEMRGIARTSGMRIYGPNCPGLTNLADRIGMTFSPAFADDRTSGPLGIATQGGGLGRNILQSGVRGSGAALWASLGNAVDLDVADFVHHMAADPAIRVIVTLFEGIRDGARLLAALRAAAEAGKPVVTLKVGHSAYGERAVQSHTAAMAGSAAVNSAVLAQLGVVEVRDTDELVDVAWLLARATPPARTRVALFGASGGALSLAADLVGSADLEPAELADGTRASLRADLPAFAAVDNPVDTTATTISEPGLFDRALRTVAGDPGVDLVLMPIPLDYAERSATSSRAIAAAQEQTDVPIVPVWMSDRRGPGWQVLADASFCSPRSLTKAVLAVRRWAEYGRWRAAAEAHPPAVPLLLRADEPGTAAALPAVDTEPRAKAWLSAAGVPVPDGEVVQSAPAARAAAERLGCSVVVKIVSSELPHKSDVGGVAVDVGSGAAAEDAWRQVTEHVALKAPHAATGGVLVERMVPADGVEMIVGVHRDPVFGHLLTVGAGGVLVELLDDVQRRLLPVGRPQAEEMVAALRCHALLTGARGRPACDVDGFVDLLVAVSDLVVAHAHQIEEIDLNPVRVRPADGAGARVVVLDALVTVSSDGPRDC
ncbi:acetate--CoA ligase family protein [Pseudonocardia sichuanensis]